MRVNDKDVLLDIVVVRDLISINVVIYAVRGVRVNYYREGESQPTTITVNQ